MGETFSSELKAVLSPVGLPSSPFFLPSLPPPDLSMINFRPDFGTKLQPGPNLRQRGWEMRNNSRVEAPAAEQQTLRGGCPGPAPSKPRFSRGQHLSVQVSLAHQRRPRDLLLN